MPSTMLVPRLRIDDRTVGKLRARAEERGQSLGDFITSVIEAAVNDQGGGEAETLYRLILAGERFGLVVGGTTTYPSEWERIGGLTAEQCRAIAAGFIAWRRDEHAKKPDGSHPQEADGVPRCQRMGDSPRVRRR